MLAPMLAIMYNKFMGATDAFDGEKMDRNCSIEMNIFSKNWSKKAMFGMFDMAMANSHIVYKFYHPSVTHRQFVMQLHAEIMALGLGRPLPPPRKFLALRCFVILIGCNVCPPPSNTVGSARQRLEPETDRVVQSDEVLQNDEHARWHTPMRFIRGYRRKCFVCHKLGKFQHGAKRKNGTPRKELIRSHWGCRYCHVALCDSTCWGLYHTDYLNQPDEIPDDKWEEF